MSTRCGLSSAASRRARLRASALASARLTRAAHSPQVPPEEQVEFAVQTLMNGTFGRLKGDADKLLVPNGSTKEAVLAAARKIPHFQELQPKLLAVLHEHVIVDPQGMTAVKTETLAQELSFFARVDSLKARALSFDSLTAIPCC